MIIPHVTNQTTMGFLHFKLKENKGIFFTNPAPSSSQDKSLKKESILQATQAYNNGNHEIQNDGCQARQLNLRLVQWQVSPDAVRTK